MDGDDHPEMLDALLEGCERPQDLLGDGGRMKELKRAFATGPRTDGGIMADCSGCWAPS